MKCDRLDGIDLVRTDLSPSELERRLEHVESCSPCRDRAAIAMALGARSRQRLPAAWQWLSVAASIGLLALWMSPAWLNQKAPVDSATLATTEAYPVVRLVTRSAETDLTEGILQAYRDRDCRRLAQLSDVASPGPDTQFLLGVCRYLNHEIEDAREAFEAGLRISNRWLEPTNWYQANIALSSRRPAEARRMLQELASRPGQYQDQARSLLLRLEAAR